MNNVLIKGNTEQAATIMLSLKSTRRCMRRQLPTDYRSDGMIHSEVEIVFKDSIEIDNLISILQEFKNDAVSQIGYWI